MFLTFGEVMLRLAPRGFLRFDQVLPGELEATFGGGEANVAVSLAMFGAPVRYLTAIPDNPVADAVVRQLRGLGVDTSVISRQKKGRLGIYFLETGANQRGSLVVYDRADSAISLAKPSDYDMDGALRGVKWLHITGITPAISEAAFKATLSMVEKAKGAGATVSCDLNFRKKLWKWRAGTGPRELAEECMRKILMHVDVAIANEEDASDVLRIKSEGSELEKGVLNIEGYVKVAAEMVKQLPGIRKVAITLRESVSASHNNWGAMMYDAASRKACFAPVDADGNYAPYEIRDIVDRVGGGDSFCAGLVYAMGTGKYDNDADNLAFAVAASCLKHSIVGDYNYARLGEVESLMAGNASGRVKR
jgi:2-dehydro-3-deoxygluconokinase